MGHELRCVAATNRDTRCIRDGSVSVDGGRVCRQHFVLGYRPFRFDRDVAVDEEIAMRAAAVRGEAA